MAEQHKVGDKVTVVVNRALVEGTYAGWCDKYGMAMVEVAGKKLYRKLKESTPAKTATRLEPTDYSQSSWAALESGKYCIYRGGELVASFVPKALGHQEKSTRASVTIPD